MEITASDSVSEYINCNTDSERILCAAIWFKDGKYHEHQPKNIDTGFVIAGRRHHNCYITASILHKSIDEGLTNYSEVKKTAVQGFLTKRDFFVDRKEAAKIAFEAGQTTKLVKTLFSEHLY